MKKIIPSILLSVFVCSSLSAMEIRKNDYVDQLFSDFQKKILTLKTHLDGLNNDFEDFRRKINKILQEDVSIKGQELNKPESEKLSPRKQELPLSKQELKEILADLKTYTGFAFHTFYENPENKAYKANFEKRIGILSQLPLKNDKVSNLANYFEDFNQNDPTANDWSEISLDLLDSENILKLRKKLSQSITINYPTAKKKGDMNADSILEGVCLYYLYYVKRLEEEIAKK
jgi:hypothetical protein